MRINKSHLKFCPACRTPGVVKGSSSCWRCQKCLAFYKNKEELRRKSELSSMKRLVGKVRDALQLAGEYEAENLRLTSKALLRKDKKVKP